MFRRLENEVELRNEFQSYRMKILSKCSGSTVHLVNNKLGCILGALDLFILFYNSGDKSRFLNYASILKRNSNILQKLTGVRFETKLLLSIMDTIENNLPSDVSKS